MMNKDEELGNIINSKFKEGEFPFDASDWGKAEKVIDTLREKKKRRRWIIIFFFGLICGTTAIIPFIIKTNTKIVVNEGKISKKPAATSQNITITEKTELEEVGTSTNLKTEGKKDVSAEQSVISTSVDANVSKTTGKTKSEEQTNSYENNQDKKSTLITVSPSKKVENDKAQENKTTENVSAPVSKKQEAVSLVKPVKQKLTKEETSNKPQGNKTIENKALPILKKKETVASVDSDKQKPIKEAKTQENKNLPVLNKQDAVTSVNMDKQKTTKEVKNNKLQENKNVENTPPPVSTNSNTPIVNKPNTVDSSHIVTSELPAIHKDSLVKKIDSAATITKIDTIAPKEKENPIQKNIFLIEAGASFNAGWNYGNTTEGKGFNPIAGLAYIHTFNPKWGIYAGVQYSSINNLNSSSYTSHHVNYDFGYNAKDTSITTKWLYYLTVPIQVRYDLNKKNYVGLGGTVSYLITSSGTITTYNETAFGSGNKNVIAQSGYSKGFNTWDASLMASYGRRLSNRLSVNLMVYLGLMDIKDNSFFSQQKFERDMGLKIVLSYNLFK